MTDTLLALIPQYGVWLLASVTFLSCLAIPVPSSILMVAGGAFVAAGDMSLITTGLAAYAGAVLGDQTGFAIGRKGSGLIERMKKAGGQRKMLFERAAHFSDKWGGTSVFLSRWLLSPLGPYVNFIGGANGLNWSIFTIFSIAGEAVWVSLYTGLGYVFSDQIEMVADIAANLSGFLAAGVVAVLLGRMALRPHKENNAKSGFSRP
ncbi:MAG: DedA family protein [Paracoccaceae bacterium]